MYNGDGWARQGHTMCFYQLQLLGNKYRPSIIDRENNTSLAAYRIKINWINRLPFCFALRSLFLPVLQQAFVVSDYESSDYRQNKQKKSRRCFFRDAYLSTPAWISVTATTTNPCFVCSLLAPTRNNHLFFSFRPPGADAIMGRNRETVAVVAIIFSKGLLSSDYIKMSGWRQITFCYQIFKKIRLALWFEW